MTTSTIKAEEAAAYLGCSKWKLYQMVAAGEIPCIHVSKKLLLFRRESLDEWMEQREQESVTKPEQTGKIRRLEP